MADAITKKELLATIKSLVGQANILIIPRAFIDYTGDLESAFLLSQIVYWSDKGSRKDGFIYKTYRDWQLELGMSEHIVRRAANHLKAKGILETKVMRANGNPTVHYRLISSAFSDSFLKFLKNPICKNEGNDNSQIPLSITQTTSDTQTETTETENDNAFSPKAECGQGVSEILNYYYETYKKFLGKKHPVLKEEQVANVKAEIIKFADEVHGELDSSFCGLFQDMIDHHFARTDLQTDYNINHFATQGILRILYDRCR